MSVHRKSAATCCSFGHNVHSLLFRLIITMPSDVRHGNYSAVKTLVTNKCLDCKTSFNLLVRSPYLFSSSAVAGRLEPSFILVGGDAGTPPEWRRLFLSPSRLPVRGVDLKTNIEYITCAFSSHVHIQQEIQGFNSV